MEKVTISIVVPERIMALTQDYLQNWILVGGNSGFMNHLSIGGVEKPEQYIPEMEIGIIHPDDDDIIRIKSFDKYDYPLAHEILREYVLPTYHDPQLEEHLWSCGVFEYINVRSTKAKKQLSEMDDILRRDNCGYFRFEKY